MSTVYLSNENNKFYLYPNDNCIKFEVDKIEKKLHFVKFVGGKIKLLLNSSIINDIFNIYYFNYYLTYVEDNLKDLFFNKNVHDFLKQIIKKKLKEYVGFYKYNFRKIKHKYKKIKIKIIQDYFYDVLSKIKDGYFFDFVKKCGGFLPFNLERLFIDFICSNKYIRRGLFTGDKYNPFAIFKIKTYTLVDVFQ